MTLENLITEKGPLVEIYPKLDPTTIRHSAEITKERITNTELRNQWFWTADSALYTLEKGEAILYFGPREQNLVFQNLKEAVKQLKNTGNYKPSDKDIKTVLESVGSPRSNKTQKIILEELNLERCNDVYGFFRVNENMNPTQRNLAKRVFGRGKDFTSALEMFAEAKIKPRIYTLNSEYIKKQDSPIARVCWLDGFDSGSYFSAFDRNVDGSGVALRGVPKNVAEGDAKIFETSYTYEGILEFMETNPIPNKEIVSHILGHINRFLQH